VASALFWFVSGRGTDHPPELNLPFWEKWTLDEMWGICLEKSHTVVSSDPVKRSTHEWLSHENHFASPSSLLRHRSAQALTVRQTHGVWLTVSDCGGMNQGDSVPSQIFGEACHFNQRESLQTRNIWASPARSLIYDHSHSFEIPFSVGSCVIPPDD
jgi:hypothetical protein